MTELLYLAAFVIPVALFAGTYWLGYRHGQRETLDELWEPAMALGAYGQQVRAEAAAEGVSVAVLLDMCVPEASISGATFCLTHGAAWPCVPRS